MSKNKVLLIVIISIVAFAIVVGAMIGIVIGVTYDSDNINSDANVDTNIWGDKYTPLDYFDYSINAKERTITLKKYRGKGKKVTISPTYIIDGDTYTVTEMVGTFEDRGKVTSVYIPDTVTRISADSFLRASSVSDIRIPANAHIDNELLDYLKDNKVVFDSIIMPKKADTRKYRDKSSDFVGDGNAPKKSLFDGTMTITVHYAGTEEQWNAKLNKLREEQEAFIRLVQEEERKKQEEKAKMDAMYADNEAYQKGKELGNQLSEDLANNDWASIQQKASEKGKELAEYLNRLIAN